MIDVDNYNKSLDLSHYPFNLIKLKHIVIDFSIYLNKKPLFIFLYNITLLLYLALDVSSWDLL